MHIIINRTKEDAQTLARLRKSLTVKIPQVKIFGCVVIGLALFIYGGDSINYATFSGYGMAAMFFWGGAAILFLEKMYPAINSSPIAVIQQYEKNKNGQFKFKIELTDSFIILDTDEVYMKMDWNVVKRFKLYKKCIVLFSKNSNSRPIFIIMQSELTEEQYNEFYSFLQEKMATQEIKTPL